MSVAHWDEVRHERRETGDIRLDLWYSGGQGLPAGARRLHVDPGARPMPRHRHWAEEELPWVLEGGGVVVIGDAAHEVGPGDVVVRPAGGEAHAWVAGEDGLDLLGFGENLDPAVVELPCAGVVRRGPLWWERGVGDPMARELAGGPFAVPAHAPRPACVVAWRDLEPLVGGAQTEAHALRRGSVAVRPPGTGVAHALRVGEDGLEDLVPGTRRPGEFVHHPRGSKVLLGRRMVRVERVADPWDGEP